MKDQRPWLWECMHLCQRIENIVNNIFVAGFWGFGSTHENIFHLIGFQMLSFVCVMCSLARVTFR